jgi:hypothetical protein
VVFEVGRVLEREDLEYRPLVIYWKELLGFFFGPKGFLGEEIWVTKGNNIFVRVEDVDAADFGVDESVRI